MSMGQTILLKLMLHLSRNPFGKQNMWYPVTSIWCQHIIHNFEITQIQAELAKSPFIKQNGWVPSDIYFVLINQRVCKLSAASAIQLYHVSMLNQPPQTYAASARNPFGKQNKWYPSGIYLAPTYNPQLWKQMTALAIFILHACRPDQLLKHRQHWKPNFLLS